MTDPYQLHRLALLPLIADQVLVPVGERLSTGLQVVGEKHLIDFVAQQGLAPLWHEQISSKQLHLELSKQSLTTLSSLRTEATAHYLLQKSSLPEIRETLDSQGIAHVIYKGVAARERLYDNPALRPAADIDLLVSPSNRDRAIACLVQAGFVLHANAENVSHEVNLQRGALTIDLHWDILRPGRTRESMADRLLGEREDAGDHWSLNPAGALFVALVHPVFAKYATAPQATLIRTLDLSRQLNNSDQARDALLELLSVAGLKTAAWIMLRHLALLKVSSEEATDSASSQLMHATSPPLLRRRYLDAWLKHNLAAKFEDRPLLVQLAFTAAAHDRPGDMANAIRAIRRAGSSQSMDLQQIKSAAAYAANPMQEQLK